MIDRWITDTEPSKRFPYLTRANADEVGPDPFSPLGWSLGWQQGCIPGVAAGFVEFGACHRSELRETDPEVFGNYGGYFYNQISLGRTMGARTPGGSPDQTDKAFFGDHPGVPPYVEHPDDIDPELSEKISATVTWMLTADDYPRMDAETAGSHEFKAARGDLTARSNDELVARGRSSAPLIEAAWTPYCLICFATAIVSGTVAALCDAIGRPEASLALLTSVGNVESAESSFAMWDLSRIVAGSPVLSAEFAAGVDGLLDRLAGSEDAAVVGFLAGFAELIEKYGHRGPNEWDMRASSWFTTPSLPLGMIAQLRNQSDDRSPHVAAEKAATERRRLAAELDAATKDIPELNGPLMGAIHAAEVWFPLRERGKNTCIRIIHEAKLAFMELGRRMVEAGVITAPQEIFMLLDSELDDFLAEPATYSATIAEREAMFQQLHELEPPYIVGGERVVPPISQWAKRGSTDGVVTAVEGEVLQGGAGAPGEVTGRAVIVLDPSDPGELEPGDIMVVHTTDPSWTSLFLSVGGVVSDVGAVSSHAAIVCRELGVPCAVSVIEATKRIPDGSTISVNGTTGAVKVLALP